MMMILMNKKYKGICKSRITRKTSVGISKPKIASKSLIPSKCSKNSRVTTRLESSHKTLEGISPAKITG